jgi:P4 family phage/plasmid primase-like protien
VNIHDFKRFVEILNQVNKGEPKQTFQTFPDRETPTKVPPKIIHGAPDEVLSRLSSLNNQLSGIYITVNQTDLQGRKAENIVRVRALFCDCDEGDLPKFPVEPSLLIQSSRGQHAYWIISDDVPFESFPGIQKAIAQKYNADPKICDLPRVMRVPGFFHHKKDPFLVQLIGQAGHVYPWRDVVEGLGLEIDKTNNQIKKSSYDRNDNLHVDRNQRIVRCESYLDRVHPAVEGQGGDAHTYYVAGIGHDFGLYKEDFWPLLLRWNLKCEPPWTEEELRKKMERAYERARGEFGNLLFLNRDSVEAYPECIPEIDAYDHEPWEAGSDSHQPDYVISPPIPKSDSSSGSGSDKIKYLNIPQGTEELPDTAVAANILRKYPCVVTVSNKIHMYDGTCWRAISERTLRGLALRFDTMEGTSKERRMRIAEYIQDLVIRYEVKWNNLQHYEIPVKNGVIDIRDMSLRPHRPSDFLDHEVATAYDPDAKAPRWERALSEWFDDQTAVNALQEFFGYCLMPHAAYKRAMILFGPSNTGKSKILETLQNLVGGENVAALGIHKMDDERALAVLVGKMVNVVSEISQNQQFADAGFKALVSGGTDPVTINEKYARPYKYIPTCKHIFATNHLPEVEDTSDGVINRLLIILCEKIFTSDTMDTGLSGKLKSEMPGILNWALEGATRLYARNGIFIPPATQRKTISRWKDDNNPVIEAIETNPRLVRNENSKILVSLLRGMVQQIYPRRYFSHIALNSMIKAAGLELVIVNKKRFVAGLEILQHDIRDESYQAVLPEED